MVLGSHNYEYSSVFQPFCEQIYVLCFFGRFNKSTVRMGMGLSTEDGTCINHHCMIAAAITWTSMLTTFQEVFFRFADYRVGLAGGRWLTKDLVEKVRGFEFFKGVCKTKHTNYMMRFNDRV